MRLLVPRTGIESRSRRRSAGFGSTCDDRDQAHAAGSPSRPPGRSVSLPVGNGAARSPQVGDNLWTRPHLTGEPGRKPGLPRLGGSSMEGTSGAADLGLLRGSSGEAALGPVRRDPRKRVARRAT